MGAINDTMWSMKVASRAVSRPSPPVAALAPSRTGWTACIRLSHDEIHSLGGWRRFEPRHPPYPVHPAPSGDARPRINEPRAWVDPTP